MVVIQMDPTMVERGSKALAQNAAGVLFAAAPGTTEQRTCARLSVSGSPPMKRTSGSAFGLPGRSFDPLPFVLCPFALLTDVGVEVG